MVTALFIHMLDAYARTAGTVLIENNTVVVQGTEPLRCGRTIEGRHINTKAGSKMDRTGIVGNEQSAPF